MDKSKTNGQALLEVALLASIFLFLLSVLISFGVSMNKRQELMMESFRHAVRRASSDEVGRQYLTYVGQYFKQIRVPDPTSPTGVSDLQEIVTGAQATRTQFLSNPWDSGNRAGAPRMQYVLYNETNSANLTDKYLEVVNPMDNATANAPGHDKLYIDHWNHPTNNTASTYTVREWSDCIPQANGACKKGYVNKPVTEANKLNPGYAEGAPKTGFTSVGVVHNVPLPKYTDTATGATRYALITRIPDPLDRYPSDRVYWSWIAIVRPPTLYKYVHDGDDHYGSNIDSSGQGFWYLRRVRYKGSNAPGDYNPPLAVSLEKFTAFDYRQSIDDEHWISLYEIAPTAVFYQSKYDPAVPLDSAHMLAYPSMHDAATRPSASAIQGAVNSGFWIQMPRSDLFSTLQTQPALSKGMEVWLNPTTVAAAFCAETGMAGELENINRTLTERMYRQGEYFTVQTLVAETDAVLHIDGKSDPLNDIDFGQVKMVNASHAMFADIDTQNYGSGVKQGISEYNLRTEVRQGQVSSEFSAGATRYKTQTDVDLTDTINRTIRTSPYGELSRMSQNVTNWTVVQERNVSGTGYNGTGWELNY